MKYSNWTVKEVVAKSSALPLKVAVATVAGLILSLTIGSFFYEVERSVIAEGQVASSVPEQNIVTSQQGAIVNLFVHEGDPVQKDQVLAEIEIPFTSHSDGTKILQSLKDRYEELSTYSTRPSKQSAFPRWIAQKSENPAINKLLSDAESTWASYRVSALRKNSENLEYAQGQALITLHQSVVDLNALLESYKLKAHAPGIASRVAVRPDQYVEKGQLAIVISPTQEKLQAVLSVPSYLIGKITIGQGVRLAIDAFPSQIFGYSGGSVLRIERSGASSFSVIASIDQSELGQRTPASEVKIMPGMRVRAFIQTRKTTLAHLIYEKLFGYSEL